MTLVELIVAMGIFTVVIAVFMAGLVVMTRNTARAQVTADAADSVRRVFQRLDKEVRYADAINAPGAGVSGARYVEFRTPATVSASGVVMCTQWRWVPSTSTIESRVWPDSSATLPGWSTVATHVVNDPAVVGYPFQMIPASTAAKHPRQTLQFSLLLESNASTGQVSTQSLLVARNSSPDSPTVCSPAGFRP